MSRAAGATHLSFHQDTYAVCGFDLQHCTYCGVISSEFMISIWKDDHTLDLNSVLLASRHGQDAAGGEAGGRGRTAPAVLGALLSALQVGRRQREDTEKGGAGQYQL